MNTPETPREIQAAYVREGDRVPSSSANVVHEIAQCVARYQTSRCRSPRVRPIGEGGVVSRGRVCDVCGEELVRSVSAGYLHASGRDPHTPIPVRHRGVRQPAIEHPSYGHKRPSGSDALFTQGDGR